MKRKTPIGHGLPIRAAGIPWFLEEDFPRIKAMMEDPEKLHEHWKDWHKAAQGAEKTYKAMGHITVRAILRPDEFAAFCMTRGLRLDSNGRGEFAAWVAMNQHRQTH